MTTSHPEQDQEHFYVLWHGTPWNGTAAAGLHGPFCHGDAQAVLAYAPAGARVVAASAGSDYFQLASALALAARHTPGAPAAAVLTQAGVRHVGTSDPTATAVALRHLLDPSETSGPAAVAEALIAAGFRARPS